MMIRLTDLLCITKLANRCIWRNFRFTRLLNYLPGYSTSDRKHAPTVDYVTSNHSGYLHNCTMLNNQIFRGHSMQDEKAARLNSDFPCKDAVHCQLRVDFNIAFNFSVLSAHGFCFMHNVGACRRTASARPRRKTC